MKRAIYFLLAVTILFAGCSKDEESGTYSLTGQVKNVSDRLVKQGTVNLMSDATVAYTTTLTAEGKYSFSGVNKGSYTLQVVVPGYETYQEALAISADASKNAVISGGTTMTGTIINSQTGEGLANATIAFTTAGVKSGSAVATDTTFANADFVIVTDEFGNYEITGMAYGVFVVVIRASGFTTRVITEVTVTSGEFNMPQVTLVESVGEGSLRIILTWGQTPYDLDSHLTGPIAGGDRFHMYYVNKEPSGSDVNLDVDDTYSYGPETTTIEAFHDGLYRFSIFNYSDQSIEGGLGIMNSPAKVEVYDATGLVFSLTAPSFTSGSGNTWRVFELAVSGNTYNIVPINDYTYYSGSGSVEKSSIPGEKPAMSFRPSDF
ncbi:MAG TPA: hypothetical protein DEO70_13625 [Bacteroidales bacterium]|nr:MAG: hypothetical protein A2X11_08880 [Bacteroidetes bacterium GWE2_42_24]OFY29945.1 MAG: hypothetical protein A2X09_15755 [Bacteroidetes bacterium GWF2_43_11]HBZ67869.1 hypothetical protein [Bacteroidales bacterium]